MRQSMINVEIHETIERPVDDVFDRLVDIPGYTSWMPARSIFLGSKVDSQGPMSEGVRYSERTRLGRLVGEISTLEGPTRLTFHYRSYLFGKLVIEGWPAYVLEPAGGAATRVYHTGVARLYGPLRPLRPLIQLIARRERGITVTALKQALENGP